eukprot:6749504-Pyramimonas_sp.AAC.1
MLAPCRLAGMLPSALKARTPVMSPLFGPQSSSYRSLSGVYMIHRVSSTRASRMRTCQRSSS